MKFYFETAPDSMKGKNLHVNPRAVVHVQDGLDTVIVEGAVSLVKDHKVLRTLAEDYKHKYDYAPDWSDEATQVVYSIKPEVARAWRAPGMHKTLVNFLF